jgi:hypothetical protein
MTGGTEDHGEIKIGAGIRFLRQHGGASLRAQNAGRWRTGQVP